MRERDKFELLLNRAGFSRKLTMKGVSGALSIKDILAHIFAYEQYVADRLTSIIQNEEYLPCKTYKALTDFAYDHGYPDFGSQLISEDESNAWVDEKYKNVALEEIVAQELHAFSQIHAALEKMKEETLLKHNLYELIADHTYRHYQEHTKEINRWLSEIRSL